jgi:signal recognition particle GTPase
VSALSTDDVAVRISRRLYEEIKKRVKESQGEFKDVREYVEFVLSEVVKEDEETKAPYTPEEEEEIKKRLKALGYI